jgi:hypothetical protein
MTTRKGKSTEQRNFKVKEPGRRKGDPQGNPAKEDLSGKEQTVGHVRSEETSI